MPLLSHLACCQVLVLNALAYSQPSTRADFVKIFMPKGVAFNK